MATVDASDISGYLTSEFEYHEANEYSYLLQCPSAVTRCLHNLLMNETRSFRKDYIENMSFRTSALLDKYNSELLIAVDGAIALAFVSPPDTSLCRPALRTIKRAFHGRDYSIQLRGSGWVARKVRHKGILELELYHKHNAGTIKFDVSACGLNRPGISLGYDRAIFGIPSIWNCSLMSEGEESVKNILNRWDAFWEYL